MSALGADRIHVETLFLRRFVAPRNSDWRHFFALKQLEREIPVTLDMCDAVLPTISGNVAYAAESLLHRIKPGRAIVSSRAWRGGPKRAVVLPKRYAARRKADVLLSNTLVPVNRQDVPLIFEYDFFHFGTPDWKPKIARELYIPEWVVERAARVRVQYEHSLAAFREQFPDHADKGVMIPHYLPHLEAIGEDDFRRKLDAFAKPDVHVLYVANQAHTKNLPVLLDAWVRASKSHPEIKLTVVSRFSEGPIDIPLGVEVHRDVPVAEVYRLMRRTHVYAMPTMREPTGATFFEAMANGCALIVPDVLPQKDLFGEFGPVAPPRDPAAWAAALVDLASDPTRVEKLARAARERFLAKYHHTNIARGYLALFRETAGRTN